MTAFLATHGADADAVFHALYWFDFDPKDIGQTVAEFFDMVRAILASPDAYRRFEDQ